MMNKRIHDLVGKYTKQALILIEARKFNNSDYVIIRKIILDAFNDYYREIAEILEESFNG
jgi:hypothetical protein